MHEIREAPLPRDHAPHLEKLFELEVPEGSYPLEAAEGRVPAWLRGSYYLNGPALFRRGDRRYRHWLDGDGLVTALHFTDEGVRAVHRYVRGQKYTEEEAAGRFLYRAFGTAFEGDRLLRGIALASPLNVSAYPFAGTLLAFGEQGLPCELDPETLETRGEYTFGGRLNAISPLSAHPAIDPKSGEMVNFGISFSARQPSLTLYRFSPEGELSLRRRLPIDHPCSVHDFGLSPSYAVFYLSPYLLDVRAVMEDGSTLIDALSWQPEKGSRLLVADRESGERLASVALGGRYCLHLINCFERPDGRLVVDLLELERPVYDQYQAIPDLFTDVAPGRPKRYEVDTGSWSIVEQRELPYDRAPDFPTVDPRRWEGEYDHFWTLGMSKAGLEGRKFFDELVHLRWSRPEGVSRYRTRAGSYLGADPVFAGEPDHPGRGVVICQQIDAERGEGSFLLFDAFEVERGPIARLPLPHAIPPCFHAAFEPA